QEEQGRLNKAEQALQRFRENRKVASVDEQIKSDIQRNGDIEKAIRMAASDVAAAKADLQELKRQRALQPKFVKTKQETSNNLAIQNINDKMAQLETDKAGLGPTFTEKSLRIKSIDEQIAKLKEQLRKTPDTVVTYTNAPNPAIVDI